MTSVVRALGPQGGRGGHVVPWLYLGRNYLAMIDYERALGAGFQRIQYARRLNHLAMEWRRPYLEWMAAMGHEYDGLVWWSSRIAERNTLLDSLFHTVCYLGVAVAIAAEARGPMVVVSESRAVLWSLAGEGGLAGRARWIGGRGGMRESVLWALRFGFVWTRYLVRAVAAQWDAWVTRRGAGVVPGPTGKPRVLIHSCLDEASFNGAGLTRDRYFTVLPDELRAAGHDVVTVPWLLTLRRSRRAAFRLFRSHPGHYLIPEDFYSLGDYLWAASIVWRQGLIPRGRRAFQGHDVTLLVREARRRQCAQDSAAKFVRYVRFIEKAAARGLEADVVIDVFENMLPEKPLVLACRQYLPKAMTVGFQHWFAPPPLRLDSFSTAAEAALAPHPDVVVCNSRFTADLLAREGLPRDRLRIGPSLRYLYMVRPPAAAAREPDTVLVVLSLEPQATLELLQKLVEAFGPEAAAAPAIRFWIKPHPMLAYREWEQLLTRRPIPPQMTVVSGAMDEWLPRASAAVVISSTSALEIALAGVPVVSVARETDFDMDPRVWFPDVAESVSTAAELRQRILEALALSGPERAALTAWAADARRSLFSALDAKTLRAFTEPVAGPRRAGEVGQRARSGDPLVSSPGAR